LRVLVYFFLFCSSATLAQLPINEEQFYSRMKEGQALPENLLTTRTAVFNPYTFTAKELETVQASFQRAGIDAVAYFDSDLLIAGRDVCVSLAQYLNSREISNLIFLQKKESGYIVTITAFNKKANFVEQDQLAWRGEHKSLEDILRRIYLAASYGMKKENYLINDFPETGLSINPIQGRRNEFYAVDLKVDPVAVPKFGNEAMDKELEEIMKMYPFKYTLTEAGLSESELRKQGSLFVLRFVHARDKVAKNVMGYDMTKSQSAIVSITYPNDQPQVKNISANAEVYKFYFKHIDSGNVYLGPQWDADLSWQEALINQLKGFRIELKIN
jgi:hypothetical protein